VASVTECNPSNNWTATKAKPDPDSCEDMSIPSYAPFSVTRVFEAVCPLGAHVTWRNFGYSASTPVGTEIQFRFRTSDLAGDGSCATLAPADPAELEALAVAGDGQGPDVCSLTDTSGTCPVDLYTGLGGLPSAGRTCLQMDADGIATVSATPELVDWSVTYDCSDAE